MLKKAPESALHNGEKLKLNIKMICKIKSLVIKNRRILQIQYKMPQQISSIPKGNTYTNKAPINLEINFVNNVNLPSQLIRKLNPRKAYFKIKDKKYKERDAY